MKCTNFVFSDTCLIFQHTIDEVENLIKKHEAFEKSAAAQEERFGALERLTTVSTDIFIFHMRCVLVLVHVELGICVFLVLYHLCNLHLYSL